MDMLYKQIIISTAIVFAAVLIFFGFRNLNVDKNKKYGLFMFSLMIMLSFSECTVSQKNDNTKFEISYSNEGN
jgi:hypothetical protein